MLKFLWQWRSQAPLWLSEYGEGSIYYVNFNFVNSHKEYIIEITLIQVVLIDKNS